MPNTTFKDIMDAYYDALESDYSVLSDNYDYEVEDFLWEE